MKPSDPSASLGILPKCSQGHWTYLPMMVLDTVIMQKSLELRVWGSCEFQPAQCVLQGSLVVPRVCDCSPGCRGAEGFSCAGLLQRWDQNRLMMFLKKRIYLKFTCKYLLHTLCKTAEIKLCLLLASINIQKTV